MTTNQDPVASVFSENPMSVTPEGVDCSHGDAGEVQAVFRDNPMAAPVAQGAGAPVKPDPTSFPETLMNYVLGSKPDGGPSRLEGRVAKHPKTAAIILAGGTGARFGEERGKQLVNIAGRPVLAWSIAAFDAVPDVGVIVVVCPKDRTEEYRAAAIDPYDYATPIIVAPAGASRQESAFSGLEYTPEEYEFVITHDGARPMVAPGLIEHVINTLKGTLDADGAIVATPAVDTLKVVENGAIVGTPDRRVFWNAQTPQAFRAGVYRRAQAAALRDGFIGTDDSSLIERLGGIVLVVEGTRDNIKLTVPEDYQMLTAMISSLGLD